MTENSIVLTNKFKATVRLEERRTFAALTLKQSPACLPSTSSFVQPHWKVKHGNFFLSSLFWRHYVAYDVRPQQGNPTDARLSRDRPHVFAFSLISLISNIKAFTKLSCLFKWSSIVFKQCWIKLIQHMEAEPIWYIQWLLVWPSLRKFK